jgi:phosphoenolpyruvate synthase/pyruvate phosphate dikinase
MADARVGSAPRTVEVERPFIVELDNEVARDPLLTGGKAAALARAATAGLATLPGVVLTTAFCDEVDAGADVADHPAVRDAFLQADGEVTALVARSSSVVEDTAASSMAGQFESIVGIRGYDAFVAAVKTVLDSRERAGAADQPIAVLVQPLIESSPPCGAGPSIW